jgi:hypothetical protein
MCCGELKNHVSEYDSLEVENIIINDILPEGISILNGCKIKILL